MVPAQYSVSSPIKTLFLQRRNPLSETIIGTLTASLEDKKTYRLGNANKLIDLISSTSSLEKGIRDHLGI